MRTRRRGWRRLVFIVIAGGCVAAGVVGLRQGLLPSAYLVLPAIDLAKPDGWLIDWRLAALKQDRAMCAQVLKPPYIEARPVADQPLENGCGWTNAVRTVTLSGARFSVDKLSCQAAAGLALWLAHDVQPLAKELLGQPVTAIRHFGSYSCRNVASNPLFKHWRSAHATANAIDIAAFTLADGRQVVIDKHWSAPAAESEFLHTILRRACRYFHVAIGPEYNAAHKNHFHFDRGIGHVCR